MRRVAWLVPESDGGIHSYSRDLLKQRPEIVRLDWQGKAPELIHVQHEYGLFGSKIPLFYTFPSLVKRLRASFPSAKVVATAHSVLPPAFRYPLRGRGWQKPLRWAANTFFLRRLHRKWGRGTWGLLDGIIVHSELQKEWIRSSCPGIIEVIPHFVPNAPAVVPQHSAGFRIVTFGYFTPEKGQDLLIKALALLPSEFRVTFAGGVRRSADKRYFLRCKALIDQMNLAKRCTILGFVPEPEIQSVYENADLVIAPFRETSGSGSLVQALARGMAVLASDLPLNLEINSRQDQCVAFFENNDPESLARKILELAQTPRLRERLRQNAKIYAQTFSIPKVWEAHDRFYEKLLK